MIKTIKSKLQALNINMILSILLISGLAIILLPNPPAKDGTVFFVLFSIRILLCWLSGFMFIAIYLKDEKVKSMNKVILYILLFFLLLILIAFFVGPLVALYFIIQLSK